MIGFDDPVKLLKKNKNIIGSDDLGIMVKYSNTNNNNKILFLVSNVNKLKYNW